MLNVVLAALLVLQVPGLAVTPEERAAALYPDVAVKVFFTDSPSLSGDYAVTRAAQKKLALAFAYVGAFGVRPSFVFGGGVCPFDTFAWLDASNVRHCGFTIPKFKEFARAIADYAAGVELARERIAKGLPATFPSPVIVLP